MNGRRIIDLDMTAEFLAALDPAGIFTFQAIGEAPGGGGNLNRVLHGTIEQHVRELTDLNAAGAGIFVMVNEGNGLASPPARTCRTNDNVVRVRSLFVDLDGAPLKPTLRAQVRPHMVIETSPGRWHTYWFGVPCPLEDFTAAQKALAERFGGDPAVCDLARVMRLPGYFHLKKEPFQTRIVGPEELSQ